jgi:hypothetical protein
VRGTTTDNVKTKRVLINGIEAKSLDYNFHQWEAALTGLQPGAFTLTAQAEDAAGNIEQHKHQMKIMLHMESVP